MDLDRLRTKAKLAAQILKNPEQYYTVVFEHGEMFCQADGLFSPAFCESMERKLGRVTKVIEGLRDPSVIDPYFITYCYYPTAPRRIAFHRRQEIKQSLPREFRRFLSMARKLTQTVFLEKVPPEFLSAIKKIGYSDEIHFWRVCRYSKYPIHRLDYDLNCFLENKVAKRLTHKSQ